MKYRLFSHLGILIFCAANLACSASVENLPGVTLPPNGIRKDLPEVEKLSEKPLFATREFQEKLNEVLEADAVRPEKLQLYQDGESYPPLKEILKSSQKYFLMNVLSFTCDSVTEDFVKLLEEKAKAGVDVRLITNKGFAVLSLSCLRRLEGAGVKVLKVRTHSSYFLNDQSELLIGSQSVARMFFLADGFNSLDRDMMLYTKGALATDALKDFISIWSQESDGDVSSLHSDYRSKRAEELKSGQRGKAVLDGNSSENFCRFTAERPSLGIKDVQELWEKVSAKSAKEVIFSGVKVDIGNEPIGKVLKEKSRDNVSIRYLGNGYLGGNGELTMVLTEWSAGLTQSGLGFFAKALQGLSDWDRMRLAKKTKEEYESLQADSKIKVFSYFNFIHYKVWSFDGLGSYIGSANLDTDKFNKVYEAGVFCLDSALNKELRRYLARDENNSVEFVK